MGQHTCSGGEDGVPVWWGAAASDGEREARVRGATVYADCLPRVVGAAASGRRTIPPRVQEQRRPGHEQRAGDPSQFLSCSARAARVQPAALSRGAGVPVSDDARGGQDGLPAAPARAAHAREVAGARACIDTLYRTASFAASRAWTSRTGTSCTTTLSRQFVRLALRDDLKRNARRRAWAIGWVTTAAVVALWAVSVSTHRTLIRDGGTHIRFAPMMR